MDSIPDFTQSQFYAGSPMSKHIGKELIFLLLRFGLNINYLSFEGFTPLQFAIEKKLKTLQRMLLSGYIPDLDLNIRCRHKAYQD